MTGNTLPRPRRPTQPLQYMVCLAAIAALLLLVTCAPGEENQVQLARLSGPPAAAAEPAAAARFTASEFIAADGTALPLRKSLPKGDVKAVILALHGFNDYSSAFEMPAKVWAERGIATFAYDQRGFGAAPGRGLWAGGATLAADALVASRILRALYPGRPIFLLGESMGGAVSVVVATGAAGLPTASVDGVILSAPAVWGRPTMEIIPKLVLWAGVRLFPAMVLSGRGLGIMASDNLPMLRALSRDPMVIKTTRVDAIYGLVNLMDLALAAAPRLDVPLLLMYGAHDEVIPPDAVRAFVAELPRDRADRRLAFYRQGYHLLLRDLEGAVVASDIASWIYGRTAPLPSHADRIESAGPQPPANPPAWPPERAGAG
jgi:acylglycerol lipase